MSSTAPASFFYQPGPRRGRPVATGYNPGGSRPTAHRKGLAMSDPTAADQWPTQQAGAVGMGSTGRNVWPMAAVPGAGLGASPTLIASGYGPLDSGAGCLAIARNRPLAKQLAKHSDDSSRGGEGDRARSTSLLQSIHQPEIIPQ